MAAVLVLVASACANAGSGAGELESQIAAAVEEQLDALNDADADQVRAIVAARDGDVVYQRYTGTTPGEYRDVASVTKSVMSTLVGIAVADGLLSLDDTLAESLPSYAGQMKPAVSRVTVRHLLTMTGGFPARGSVEWVALLQSPPRDLVAAILAAGTGPTRTFVYSDAGVHVLSAVLKEATGMTVLDYAREKLFDPLEIDTRPVLESPASAREFEEAGFAWLVDPQGVHAGWAMLKLRPQDMLKLGQLYLDRGVWQYQRILPADWVQEATTRQVDTEGAFTQLTGYGYLWWVGEMDEERAFAAVGLGGQLIVVVPGQRLVVVTSVEMPFDGPPVLTPETMSYIVESAVVSMFGADQ